MASAAAPTVYWYTVGLGHAIHTRYGHTLIRIVQKTLPRDRTYNWGMFDFSDPALPLNFFTGRLRYWLGFEHSIGWHIRFYRNYEKRPLWEDRLRLTPAQSQHFVAQVKQKSTPEHKYFWYHHFYKNCATIPRDILNNVLYGKLKQRYAAEDSGTTLRSYVRHNLNTPPFVGWFLDITMNSLLDQPLSKWDEMFYPLKLREHLQDFRALDDEGNPLDLPLLHDSRQLLRTEMPQPPLTNYALIVSSLLWGVTLSAWATRRRLFSGLALALYGLFATFFGTVMLGSWLFSTHLDLHHNANLWLFWPLDIFWLVYAGKWICGNSDERGICNRHSATRLLQLHLIAAIIYSIGNMSGWVMQDCSDVMMYLLPPFFGFGLFVYRRLRRVTSNDMNSISDS